MFRTSETKHFVRPFEECDDESSSLDPSCAIIASTCMDDVDYGTNIASGNIDPVGKRAKNENKYKECRQAFESDSDSSDSDNAFDDDDIGVVFDEIQQKHGHELTSAFSKLQKPVTEGEGIGIIDKAIDQISGPKEESRKELQHTDESCAKCCRKTRVLYVSSFERGQHIRIPGGRFTFDLGKKLVSVYEHHAIVKEVCKLCGTKVEVVLIHYTRIREKDDLHIHKTTEVFDLEKDEIYIVEYMHPRYSQDEIVQRAESMLLESEKVEDADSKSKDFTEYAVLSQNCEHFATWCVVGKGECFQIQSFRKSAVKYLSKGITEGCKIARFVKRFLLNATDEIATGFNKGLHLPGICLGATLVIYLIYCCVMTGKHYAKYNKCELCKSCFKREMIGMWANFGTFIATSGLTYAIVHFCLPSLGPAGIPCMLALVVLAISLQWSMSKLRKALLMPYSCDSKPISRLSDINVGDMISFRYFSIPHNAIVTEVHIDNNESAVGLIRCVHYGLKGWNIFGTREVIEEYLPVDLRKKQINLVDCTHLKKYLPNRVVQRVKKRVGERKWSPFSNRSDHLCFSSLVFEKNDRFSPFTHTDDIGETNSKKNSSLCDGEKEVHLLDDLQPGEVVRYERKCRRNCDQIGVRKDKGKNSKSTGIVKKLEGDDEREFEMQLIVYENKCSKLETFNVDLKIDRLFIKNYHPAHCHSMEERVQRACKGLGGSCKYEGEDHFIESCLLKEIRNPSKVKVVAEKVVGLLAN